ncbi:hypothetical protein ACFPRL_23105 [Pseudoclavibacter helvolus]
MRCSPLYCAALTPMLLCLVELISISRSDWRNLVSSGYYSGRGERERKCRQYSTRRNHADQQDQQDRRHRRRRNRRTGPQRMLRQRCRRCRRWR